MIDAYDFQARQAPGLVAISPVVLLAIATVPGLGQTKLVAGSIAFMVVIALQFVAMRLVRSAGRSRQENLFRAWGGMPTTAMLRHSDTRLNPQTKRTYHERLRQLGAPFPIPDEQDERRDPVGADIKFGAAMDEVRRRAKAMGIKPVNRENINYGAARNTYGLKPFGLGMCCISLVVLAVIIATRGTFLPTPLELIVGSAILIMGGAWVLAGTSDMVRQHAEAYALALFEAIDVVVPARPRQKN